jgi:hypothetical protein
MSVWKTHERSRQIVLIHNLPEFGRSQRHSSDVVPCGVEPVHSGKLSSSPRVGPVVFNYDNHRAVASFGETGNGFDLQESLLQ